MSSSENRFTNTGKKKYVVKVKKRPEEVRETPVVANRFKVFSDEISTTSSPSYSSSNRFHSEKSETVEFVDKQQLFIEAPQESNMMVYLKSELSPDRRRIGIILNE